MTKKIMLVEDDKSLREIYGVRLLAEGYDIVSAGDGEEALAMAIKERPHLIISDVMMPKISGFDLLDILRSTTETKNIKVIMMTALSSEDQRIRGEQLGADKYLVKSQVGIEDVVRVVHEVMEDTSTPPSNPTPPSEPPATPPQQPTPPAANNGNNPNVSSRMMATPPAQQPGVAPGPSQFGAQPQPVDTTTPSAAGPNPLPVPTPPPHPVDVHPPQARSRVIQPLNDPSVPQVNLNDLLDKEMAKEAGIDESFSPQVATTDQTKSLINEQISQFQPSPEPEPIPVASVDSIPTISVDPSGNMSTPAPQEPVQNTEVQQQSPSVPSRPINNMPGSAPLTVPSRPEQTMIQRPDAPQQPPMSASNA